MPLLLLALAVLGQVEGEYRGREQQLVPRGAMSTA